VQRVRIRPLAMPALIATALLAAGCTAAPTTTVADDFEGTQKQVAEVIDDFAAAAVDGDAQQICDTLFAADLKDALGPDCEDAVDQQTDDISDGDIDVKSIEVDGDTATATVVTPYGGDDVEQTMTFVREDNRWRISEVSPPPQAQTDPAS
jgi:hypothetical protein